MNKKTILIILGIVVLVVVLARVTAKKKAQAVKPSDIATTQEQTKSPGVLTGEPGEP